MFLLDTNVLSEPMKKAPNPGVVAWLAALGGDFLISAISMEELRYGAQRMQEGRRRNKILAAIDALCAEYGSKIEPFTADDAALCAGMRAQAWCAGNNVAYQDIAIAATALRKDAVVATRNIKDFAILGVETLNPFSA